MEGFHLPARNRDVCMPKVIEGQVQGHCALQLELLSDYHVFGLRSFVKVGCRDLLLL